MIDYKKINSYMDEIDDYLYQSINILNDKNKIIKYQKIILIVLIVVIVSLLLGVNVLIFSSFYH